VIPGADRQGIYSSACCDPFLCEKKNLFTVNDHCLAIEIGGLGTGCKILLAFIAEGDTIYLKRILSQVVGVFFIVGLVAAAYSSADSALTALTTSYTVDILDGKKMEEQKLTRTRRWAMLVYLCGHQ